ncbi:HAD family hydrolase [Anaerorhabdus sp.]|uniref:HAD family hydrolase n=1 Tax=Anaerorhabdus sp. TaxID=1872524 RepID=UPI002FC594B5
MKNKYKLVICDIDGTLVGRFRNLSDQTRSIIQRLHDKGVYFGLASGRPVDEVIHLVREVWQLEEKIDVVIGMNGSELCDNVSSCADEYFKLSTESLKEIMDLMKPFDVNACIYRPGAMLCQIANEQVQASVSRSGKKVVIADSIEDFYSEESAKIMFRTDEETINKIEQYTKTLESNKYKAFRTGPIIIEFADTRVSKAYALKEFCENNNIELSEVIAFGDTTNDNEMLSVSGMGVCLLNGSADTKKCADYITEKNNEEEGFADFMNKQIFDKNII